MTTQGMLPGSREIELLRLCARPLAGRADTVAEETAAAMLKLAGELDDGGARFAELAGRHRCVLLALDRLNRLPPDGLPPGLLGRLSGRSVRHAARSVLLHRLLWDVLDRMASAGIPARPFKGVTLAILAHGDAMRREYDDVDVLIPERHFLRAVDVLTAGGYRPLIALSPAEGRAHMRAGWDRAFKGPDGGGTVELGTGAAFRHFGRPLSAGWMWAPGAPVPVEGRETPSFALDVLLLLLCQHGAKHAWQRLQWIADVAGLIARHPECLSGGLPERAARHGSLRMLLLGVELAGRLGAVPMDDGVRRAIGRDLRVGAQADAIWARQAAATDATAVTTGTVSFHLAVHERARDRMRYLLLWALTPSYSDWHWVRLPRGLFFLHWLLRPIRLLFRRRP